MKQLIEEQNQIQAILEAPARAYVQTRDIRVGAMSTTELGEKICAIYDWHKQSLKQFIDGLIEEANVRVATLEELKAKFNLEIDKHRIDEVERYISYLKKLKEQLN